MKLTKYVLPYPVLGIDGAFEKSCIATGTMTSDLTPTHYKFNVQLSMDDETIKALIDDKKAAYACEVDCPKTYFRKVYISQSNKFSFAIPRTSLIGESVPFFFSVIALTAIDGYKNPNFNQRFYGGYKFNLQKGHMLGYLGTKRFDADVKYDELTALDTIVEVIVDSTAEYTKYDFSGDKISIILPQNEFENFVRSNNSQLANLTHASIVQCGLISALYSYKKYGDSSRLWVRTLNQRLLNDKKFSKFKPDDGKASEFLGNLDDSQIAEIVNILLGNANQRMFETITSLCNNPD